MNKYIYRLPQIFFYILLIIYFVPRIMYNGDHLVPDASLRGWMVAIAAICLVVSVLNVILVNWFARKKK
ncbi:MAG: hypothetical protein EOO09_06305 [Chitinophagaceae bacterium]|nr:MAG: hypothetical protein EOO09_06305 [Chitinophagaceae bacterium]